MKQKWNKYWDRSTHLRLTEATINKNTIKNWNRKWINIGKLCALVVSTIISISITIIIIVVREAARTWIPANRQTKPNSVSSICVDGVHIRLSLSLCVILIRRHLCVDFTAASHSAFSHDRTVCSVASAEMYLQNGTQIHTLAKT